MKKGIVISTQCGDWEALFIGNELISQGHHLGEGQPAKFWMDIANKYELTSDDIANVETNNEDEEMLMGAGRFEQGFDIEKYS